MAKCTPRRRSELQIGNMQLRSPARSKSGLGLCRSRFQNFAILNRKSMATSQELHLPRWNAPALETLFELAQEYGDVAPLSAFGVPFLLFSHPEHIEEILRQKSRAFKKDCYLDALRPLLGNGLFTSEGAAWRRQRAVARPLFAAQQITQYVGTVVEFAD